MKTKYYPIIVLLLGFITGCKVSYINTYQTYLMGTQDESLAFKDSLIMVTFDPKPNGIVFDVQNLTKNNLYLIWDKSYFVKPDGSSSKSLNTDVLETSKTIIEKENYESIVPQQGHFIRFTCSSKDINFFSVYNSSTIYNEALRTINSITDYSRFFYSGAYWDLSSSAQADSKKSVPNLDRAQITEVQKFILKNNELGMGFTLKNKGKEYEYHFKFPIKKVLISRKSLGEDRYVLNYELSKENGFVPTNIPKGNYSFQKSVVPNSNQLSIILKCSGCGKDFKVTGIDKGSVNCPYCNALNTFGQETKIKKKNR